MMIAVMAVVTRDSIFLVVSARMAILENSVKQILTHVRRISSRVTQA